MLSTKCCCRLMRNPLRIKDIHNWVFAPRNNIDFNESTATVLNYCTEPVETIKPKQKVKSVKKPEVLTYTKEVLQFLKTVGILPDSIPVKLLRRKRVCPEHLYLVDENVAEKFAKLIIKDLRETSSQVLEANPGPGLLTKELLKAEVPAIALMEPYGKFKDGLMKLKENHPEKLTVQVVDLFAIWKLSYQDAQDNGNRIKTALANVPIKKWDEEPCMQIIGALPNRNFISHLITSLVTQTSIMTYGRPVMYVAIPPPVWIQLTCDKSAGYILYRASSVLFQLIFDYKFLGKLPRKAFLPWETQYSIKKGSKLRKVMTTDPEYMYVVRIEAKRNLFTDVMNLEQLQPFWYFIRHHMISRKNRIIPQLERWLPGCGPKLIAKDFNIFTEFGELRPEELLQIYKDFSSWPGFDESTFLPSMETCLLKMEQGVDIDGEEEVEIAEPEPEPEPEPKPKPKNVHMNVQT